MKKILVLTNSINGLYSFRRELIECLLEQNFNVTISSPVDIRTRYFIEIGCEMIETNINRRSTNPILDFRLMVNYFEIMKNVKADIVLTYTIKPNVYGGIACRLANIPYIPNITGLGTSIENKGLLRLISTALYRIGLKKASVIFFQNLENKNYFLKSKITDENTAKVIPGSGVNLLQHKFEDYPERNEIVKFLYIGRLMKSKGIDELLEAIAYVVAEHPNVEFHFVGKMEDDYSNIIQVLSQQKYIVYHGQQNNVHHFIKDSHAIINPSYHEGMSNVLLEAASTGRPVLASNVPGCRETFVDGVTGFAFAPRNAKSLAETIIKFIKLPFDEKKKMGIMGRKKMEREFDRNIVVNAYLKEINSIVGSRENI
jgi:glycosyltransferase involved in cell wall biosynthesis